MNGYKLGELSICVIILWALTCSSTGNEVTGNYLQLVLTSMLRQTFKDRKFVWAYSIGVANSFNRSEDILSFILSPYVKSICNNIITRNHWNIFYRKRHVQFGHCHPCLPETQKSPFLCLGNLNWIWIKLWEPNFYSFIFWRLEFTDKEV